MSIYIRLGARASSFYDFATKVSLSGKEVLELPNMPDSKFFKKALHSGHVVLCSKIDFDEFAKNSGETAQKVETKATTTKNVPEEFIYVEPASSSKEDISASMETVKDFKTLIKWCELFGFVKEDLASVKKLNDTDLAKVKEQVVDIASEYGD